MVRDLAELLTLGIDYAVLACPTALHEEIGVRLADAGICTLIEKPLAHAIKAAQHRRLDRRIRRRLGRVRRALLGGPRAGNAPAGNAANAPKAANGLNGSNNPNTASDGTAASEGSAAVDATTPKSAA